MTENDVLLQEMSKGSAATSHGGEKNVSFFKSTTLFYSSSPGLCWNIKEKLLQPEGNTKINNFNKHFWIKLTVK